MLRKAGLTLCLCFWMGLACAKEGRLASERLSERIYLIYGGGGLGSHVGLFTAKGQILMVDTMMAKAQPNLITTIQHLNLSPVNYLINTHDHFDHTGVNQYFIDQGAKLLVPKPDAGQFVFSPLGEIGVEVMHSDSHSSSDVVLYFPGENVVFMGDTFTNEWYPTFFHGGMDSQIKMIDAVVKKINNNTKVVPGHGFVSDRQGLLTYKKNCLAWMARIRTLRKQGKSVDQIAKDEVLRELRWRFNPLKIMPENFEKIYAKIIKNTVTSMEG